MKKLLLTAVAVLVSLALVACGGESKKSAPAVTFEVMPSVSFPAVPSTTDPCPRTEVTGSKVLAAGAGFSIDCGTASGLIVAGILKASDLAYYRRFKVEADKVLCSMFTQDFINRRISWAPPTPRDLELTSDDVHTVCSEGK